MRKVQWCVKCKKYHLFDDVNWKYNWKQRTWECLKTEDLEEDRMTLRTPKPTREERAAMTHDELLRSIWLLDEVIELFRWI
ncbi:hypothetical protein CRH03_16270, partial [Clostridium sp. HMb25]